MHSTPGNLTLEESTLIIQFLQTLSDDIWQVHETELLKKLNQFCHKPNTYEMGIPFEDEIPF